MKSLILATLVFIFFSTSASTCGSGAAAYKKDNNDPGLRRRARPNEETDREETDNMNRHWNQTPLPGYAPTKPQ